MLSAAAQADAERAAQRFLRDAIRQGFVVNAGCECREDGEPVDCTAAPVFDLYNATVWRYLVSDLVEALRG